jgi:hypothetical protein
MAVDYLKNTWVLTRTIIRLCSLELPASSRTISLPEARLIALSDRDK